MLPVFLCLGFSSFAQKAKIFTTADFDLIGDVKTCLVTTDYGKEEFYFNKDGLLTKLITRYSDSDYDVTYYKFINGEISQKRVENYRDGLFDKNTSIANIYTLDSIDSGIKITEKILSYNKEFLDQYEYTYNEDNQLTAIKRNNDAGIESTVVDYKKLDGETTTTYILDEELKKSVRESELKSKLNTVRKVKLTKEYLEGKLDKALEEVFTTEGKLLSENKFVYDTVAKSFVSKELKIYKYNELGMLISLKTKRANSERLKNFIYQYDNGETGNWIKQIITPDNTYITRKITYYETAPVVEE